MAHPPQQGPSAASLLMQQPSTSITAGSVGSNGGSPSMQPVINGRIVNSWEGDKMLHVYMIDYCRKRGYTPVVNALCSQTGHPPDVKAPIDAPQGLLFEWWVVFWDIFTSKSEDDPKKNAVAYLQDQRAKNFRPMHQADVKPQIGGVPNFNGPHAPPSSGAIMGSASFPGHPAGQPNQQHPGMQPMPTPNGVPPAQQHHPPQPPGAPTPVPPPAQHVNGPQPYPPQPQSQQPPHPNAANGPQGPPPPGQTPGVPQPINMGNRPGVPSGPQMPMGAQRGPLGAPMQNGQVGHQPFVGSLMGPNAAGPHPSPRSSQMGPPQGVRGHPQQPGQQHPQQQGGPANAPTPGGTPMANGMAPNQTPLMAAQQFMNAGRPGSRSGTPGSQVGGSQPGVGMSPSRAGGPPMQPRPGSQMGGPQQPGGQGSPFTGHMPGPGGLPISPQMMNAVMRSVGLEGRTQESLNQNERNNLHAAIRMQAARQPGMGTPRIASGGNPMMPGAPQPGPGGLQGGMPGNNFHPQQQFQQSQHMMGQPGPQLMKRPGSPIMQMDTPSNESSPPERKRLRKDSQNGTPTSMPGFAPGAPGVNGMPGQQPMPNGIGNPGMMRPPTGAPGNPGQTMNPMMVNGGPHGPGANPMHIRGPQQPGPQRFPMQMQKPGGLVPNPHGPGLPIPVKSEGGAIDMQQQAANLAAARGMQQPKVQPSPSIPNAKAGGSMPPPSHTPNPLQPGAKVGPKDEPMDGIAKSSPGTKPGTQNPPTPVPNPVTPANAQNLSIFNSAIGPSPGAILAQHANLNQSTPPTNASRPGSTANPQTAAMNNAMSFTFPGPETYSINDFALLDSGGFYEQDMPSIDDAPNFDLLSEFLNPSAVAITDEDIAAAAGGTS